MYFMKTFSQSIFIVTYMLAMIKTAVISVEAISMVVPWGGLCTIKWLTHAIE